MIRATLEPTGERPDGRDDLLRRVPEHDAEAERCVLGACLLDSRAFDAARAVVSPDDFYRSAHESIFRALQSLRERGAPANDPVALASELRSRGALDAVGGPAYLAALTSSVATAANVVYHARLVRDSSRIRAAERALAGAMQRVADASTPVADRLAEVDRVVREATLDSGERGPEPISELVRTTFRQLREPGPGAVPTGFHGLDDLTGGLPRGEVSILGARTAVGKSFFAGAVSYRASAGPEDGGPGHRVVLLTLEMPAVAVVRRLLTGLANVPQRALRDRNRVEGDLRDDLEKAGELLDRCRLWIDDSPAIGPDRVHALARGHQAEHGLDLLVVDYVQLLENRTRRFQNRQEEVEAVSRALKLMAADLGVAVLALAQLNRRVEERPKARPILSDLRSSGALEQDAGIVFLLSRIEQTAEEKARAAANGEDDSRTQALLLEVAKNRYGPIGEVRLIFDRDTGALQEEAPFPRVERPRAGGQE